MNWVEVRPAYKGKHGRWYDAVAVRADGRVRGRRPTRNSHGYLTIGYGGRIIKVQHLVAEAFVPNPDSLPILRHLNDVRDDNRACNLAWGTHRDNVRDAMRNGNWCNKLGSDDYTDIKRMVLEIGMTRMAVAQLFGIDNSYVGKIVKGQYGEAA